MNREEALIYLPIDDENDAQDLYEEKLFELKQFFLSRFPMTKLINARLLKFGKIEEAYRALGGEIAEELSSDRKDYPLFDSFHDLYKWYNQERNTLRLQLSSADSLSVVSNVMKEYLRATRHYATHWKVPTHEIDDTTIKLGVEPNPMDLQSAINALSHQEKLNSEYILSLPDENCLKSEAKRLSLWLNFEIDE